MSTGLVALFVSLGAVVLAEMGDKTQLLAMAFAAKYKAVKVMIGVFIATVLNHALAVAVGSYIAHFGSLRLWIQAAAALSFIFFGLWTIRGDKLEGEENRKTKYGAIITVAFAFFLAEMGDKTQLATIALAAKYPVNPLWVLSGTTLGMLIADGIGIIVSVVLCRRIPERTVKMVSAIAFMFFGLVGSYQVGKIIFNNNTSVIITVMAVLIIATSLVTYRLIKKYPVKVAPEDGEFCKINQEQDINADK